jgi:hypothetical protein
MTHFRHTHTNRHGGDAQPINLAITFLRRCSVGSAQIEVNDLKLGQKISVIQLTLRQHGGDKLVANVIMSNLGTEKGHTVVPTDNFKGPSKELSDGNTWQRVDIPHPQFRRAPAHVEVHQPTQKKCTVVETGMHWEQCALLRWQQADRIIHGRWTNEAAGFLLDVFPAPLAELEEQVNATKGESHPVWFPTLSLNIDFKAPIGEAGLDMLYSCINIQSIRNGRMDIRVKLHNERGQMLAIGNHCTLITSPTQAQGKL